jgi:predicted transposase/invertase (TIGR01784 family)
MDIVREYRKTMSLNEAMLNAVEACINKNVLKTFLETHKQEVCCMLLTDWDLDTALDVSKEEGIEIGTERGVMKTARAMKEKGFDINTIVEVTELPVDVILKL